MKNKIKLRIFIIITIILGFTGFIFSQTHISMWGFNISKSELKDVLINTKDNNYIITNPRFVLELTEQVSKMKKLYKIEPNNFPPKETTTKYLNLMIRAKYTYGGSFWKDGDNGMMIDSNGYYWDISKEFLEVIDESVKDAQMLN